MIHMFAKKVGDLLVSGAKSVKKVAGNGKKYMLALAAMLCANIAANAQSLSGTDYTAGTSALETVATQVAAYVPYVVNLCYAIAGVVAVVGAISVYIAMNNEEQDVKNILVLKNWRECIRKEMLVKALYIKYLREFLNFHFFFKPTLKKI